MKLCRPLTVQLPAERLIFVRLCFSNNTSDRSERSPLVVGACRVCCDVSRRRGARDVKTRVQGVSLRYVTVTLRPLLAAFVQSSKKK